MSKFFNLAKVYIFFVFCLISNIYGEILDSVPNPLFDGMSILVEDMDEWDISDEMDEESYNVYFEQLITTEIKFADSIAIPLEKAGKTLFGESTYLLLGPHSEQTHVDCFGELELSDKVRVTFINGILNTSGMMLQTLAMISQLHGGVKVHYVFRPTEGWTWDISRAIMIKWAFSLGYRSLHAHLLARMWKDLIQEMGGVENGGVIIHYAHSLGGSETDRARTLLSLEEQKMVRVITIGSSTLIRNEGFQKVINLVSVNDGVSGFFIEPFGHIRNFFDPLTNVYFYRHPLASYWPTDHLLSGATYSLILEDLGKKFIQEFGGMQGL